MTFSIFMLSVLINLFTEILLYLCLLFLVLSLVIIYPRNNDGLRLSPVYVGGILGWFLMMFMTRRLVVRQVMYWSVYWCGYLGYWCLVCQFGSSRCRSSFSFRSKPAWINDPSKASLVVIGGRLVGGSFLAFLITLLASLGRWSLDCWGQLPRCRRFFSTEDKLFQLVLPPFFLRSCGVSAPGSSRWLMEVISIADDLDELVASLHHLTSLSPVISFIISFITRRR